MFLSIKTKKDGRQTLTLKGAIEKNKKKFEKTLDKSFKVWYNKDTIKERLVTTMYRVSFIYAPYQSETFISKKKAIEFQQSKVAASKLEKLTFFGRWKPC